MLFYYLVFIYRLEKLCAIRGAITKEDKELNDLNKQLQYEDIQEHKIIVNNNSRPCTAEELPFSELVENSENNHIRGKYD